MDLLVDHDDRDLEPLDQAAEMRLPILVRRMEDEADNIEGVVSLAQMDIVEIHTWNSTDDDIERPNRIVWDLDPGPNVAWKQIVTAAKFVREVLMDLAEKQGLVV